MDDSLLTFESLHPVLTGCYRTLDELHLVLDGQIERRSLLWVLTMDLLRERIQYSHIIALCDKLQSHIGANETCSTGYENILHNELNFTPLYIYLLHQPKVHRLLAIDVSRL